jgi:hypothetical protein
MSCDDLPERGFEGFFSQEGSVRARKKANLPDIYDE